MEENKNHLLIHILVAGYWVVSHFLTTMNNAAMEIHIEVYVWTCFLFSCINLGVELLGQMVTLKSNHLRK